MFASCFLYLFEEIRFYRSLILEKTKHFVQSGHAKKKIIIIYRAFQAVGDKEISELIWFGCLEYEIIYVRLSKSKKNLKQNDVT